MTVFSFSRYFMFKVVLTQLKLSEVYFTTNEIYFVQIRFLFYLKSISVLKKPWHLHHQDGILKDGGFLHWRTNLSQKCSRAVGSPCRVTVQRERCLWIYKRPHFGFHIGFGESLIIGPEGKNAKVILFLIVPCCIEVLRMSRTCKEGVQVQLSLVSSKFIVWDSPTCNQTLAFLLIDPFLCPFDASGSVE